AFRRVDLLLAPGCARLLFRRFFARRIGAQNKALAPQQDRLALFGQCEAAMFGAGGAKRAGSEKLPKNRGPLLLALVGADAEGFQGVMAVAAQGLVFRAGQEIA